MKNEWKTEWYRATHSNYFKVAMLIGGFISLAHFVLCVCPLYQFLDEELYPFSVYGKWIGIDNISVYSSMYYFLLPILIALPFVGTLKEDLRTGYVRNVFIRVDKCSYYIAKFSVNFVVAGMITVIPLILNFILTAMVLPLVKPQSGSFLFPIYQCHFLGDFYYEHPFCYVVIYLILNFIFMGLLSVTGLLAAFFCERVFSAMLTPFMVYLLLYALTQITGWHEVCPFAFLRPGQPITTNIVIVAIEIGLLLGAGGIYYYVGEKKEIY